MTIKEYQKDCFSNYKTSIGYESEYKYLFGNPINTLVPIETALNKFMIVGAYPSAKFFTIKNVSTTPVCDNDSPFSNESYFDGSTVRTIPSGKELNEVILENIGIERSDCWITDLVKVFLFKQGHIDRYDKLQQNVFSENRSRFKEYASRSIVWLEKEIKIAKPKLIILLGLEVIASVFGISENKAKEYIDGEVKPKIIGGKERKFICLPHPGILMRKFDRNPWPERFRNEIAPKVKAIVEKI
jgi:uracil-DNA glycosylase